MRKTFIDCLIKRARIDKNIFLITPDLGFSVLEPFADEFPNNFLNVGIAEQNAIGIATGLSLCGKNVYIYSIIPFLTMRCFEQIRIDIAYMKSNVKLIGIGAGFSYGSAGATHHSIEDIAIMRSLPNMTVCCPGDPFETEQIICQSFDYKGPMYVRLGRSGEPIIHKSPFSIGEGIKIKDGKDLILITTSNLLEEGQNWVNEWKKENIDVALISMPTIKPINTRFIKNLIKFNIPIITLEEHNIIGGLGSAVAEIIAESGVGVKFKRIGIPDNFSHYIGNQNYIREKMNIIRPNIKDLFNLY